MGLRVELFARIRRDARVEELSIRQLARRQSVARATVRQALAQAEPPARKIPVRVAPKLDPFTTAIDAMLVEDLTAPRKQCHTARRILARLAEERGAAELSYSTVRDYVAVRRPQMLRARHKSRQSRSSRAYLPTRRESSLLSEASTTAVPCSSRQYRTASPDPPVTETTSPPIPRERTEQRKTTTSAT